MFFVQIARVDPSERVQFPGVGPKLAFASGALGDGDLRLPEAPRFLDEIRDRHLVDRGQVDTDPADRLPI